VFILLHVGASCVFHMDIMFVFIFKIQYNSNMYFKLK
jgi:hypothetical protein